MSKMSSFSICTVLWSVMVNGQNPQLDPNIVMDQITNIDSSTLLRTIFSFMSDDEFALLEPITSNLSGADMHDLSKWQEAANHSAWDSVYSAAEELCTELHLESTDCKADCLNYNSIPSWIGLLAANNSESMQQLLKMVKLYSVSAGPISWMDVGNVDQCEYFEGTYCYTPAYYSYINAMQHACCIPGSCTGMDAFKVVSANNWCYKTYHDALSEIPNVNVFPVCEQLERDMEATSGWTTIIIFFIFLGFVVIASVLKRWCVEFAKVDTKLVDSNPFIKIFNVQSIWSAFGKTRPKEHSSMNFLDGVRVWSMTWVCIH